MAIVKRGNVELTVGDYLVDEYLDMGYSQLDEISGAVLRRKKSSADIIAERGVQIGELEKRIESLKKENEKLISEITALKASHAVSNEGSSESSTNPTPKKSKANKGV